VAMSKEKHGQKIQNRCTFIRDDM